jgi:hypothetical protein
MCKGIIPRYLDNSVARCAGISCHRVPTTVIWRAVFVVPSQTSRVSAPRIALAELDLM